MGYSLNDPDFDLMITELSEIFGGATPPHYALLPTPDLMKVRDLKDRLNIRTISYDPSNDHSQLSSILEEIENSTQVERRTI